MPHTNIFFGADLLPLVAYIAPRAPHDFAKRLSEDFELLNFGLLNGKIRRQIPSLFRFELNGSFANL